MTIDVNGATDNISTVSGANAGVVSTSLYNTWQNKLDASGANVSISRDGSSVTVDTAAGTADTIGAATAVLAGVMTAGTYQDLYSQAGIMVSNGTNAINRRSIVGADDKITVSDGDAISANPTIQASGLLRRIYVQGTQPGGCSAASGRYRQ